MREAAALDRQLNENRQPATKKLSMLDMAVTHLKKYDLIEGFLEANVLTALTEWLSPMPDKSLPSTKIREAVLKWLINVSGIISSRKLYIYSFRISVATSKSRNASDVRDRKGCDVFV